MLTLNREIVKRETVTEVLEAPKDWAMFSAAGNRRIRNYAIAALRQAEKAVGEGKRSQGEADRICTTFLAKWERLCYSKDHGEAGDTAVRECVGDWHDKIWMAVTGNQHAAYDAWERNRDAAYARIAKERKRK